MNAVTTMLAAAAALTLALADAGAQTPDPIAAGARVRLDLATGERSLLGRARLQAVVGTIESARGDTLLLALKPGAASLRVARASVHAAYLSGGTPPRWRAALEGAVLPALVGAALTTASMSLRRRDDDPSLGAAALSSAAWGAASGALLAAWSPRERWRRVRARAPQAAPAVAASGS
jgi:hypothetical protein